LIDWRLRPVELDWMAFNRATGDHVEMRVFSDVHLPMSAFGFRIPDTI